VHVGLGAFDVVMQVVSEHLDVADRFLCVLKMGFEEHKSDKALGFSLFDTCDTSQLIRSFSGPEGNCWRAVDVTSGLCKFLQEDFGKDLVVGVFEIDGEDDGDIVLAWFDVDGLVISVVDLNGLGFSRADCGKGFFEGGGQQMTFQETDRFDEFLWVSRDFVDIEQDGEIITSFRGGLDHASIDGFEIFRGAIFEQSLDGPPRDGKGDQVFFGRDSGWKDAS